MPDQPQQPSPPEAVVPGADVAASDTDAATDAGSERRSSVGDFWHEWIKPFLVVLIVVFGLRSAVADWNDVPTGSMRPTILEGERIFVNKVAYDLKVPFTRLRLAEWAEPDRGDVVVLYSPRDDHSKRLVKRVVGMPGDTLTIRNGRLLINGEPATYRPVTDEEREGLGIVNGALAADEQVVWETFAHGGGDGHPVTWQPILGTGDLRNFGPATIPEGRYFVMGDNRDNSADSRSFGFVPRELIVGRATAVVFSLDPEHHRAPRWDRFFQPLP